MKKKSLVFPVWLFEADNGVVLPVSLRTDKSTGLRDSEGLERIFYTCSSLRSGIKPIPWSFTVKISLPAAVRTVNNSVSLRGHSSYRSLDVRFSFPGAPSTPLSLTTSPVIMAALGRAL